MPLTALQKKKKETRAIEGKTPLTYTAKDGKISIKCEAIEEINQLEIKITAKENVEASKGGKPVTIEIKCEFTKLGKDILGTVAVEIEKKEQSNIGKTEEINNSLLADTVWIYEQVDDNYRKLDIITFNKDSTFTYVIKDILDGKVTDECKGSEGTYTLSNAGIITLKYTKQVIEGALKDSDETETAALKDNKITFPPEKK